MPERRASQRDREVAAERLKPRLVDGSLSTDTFSIRVERAFSARTKGELARLFDDLPGLRARLAELRGRATSWFLGEAATLPELRLPDTTRRIELSIGRAEDCDLLLDHPTISRHHAVLLRTPEGWVLRDTGSTNGSRLNGWRIDEAELRPGDVLALGVERFLVAAA